MSCKDTDKSAALLDHLRHHVETLCSKCQIPLSCEDGVLPFGTAMMTTWQCRVCKIEKIYIIQEDGKIYEMTE